MLNFLEKPHYSGEFEKFSAGFETEINQIQIYTKPGTTLRAGGTYKDIRTGPDQVLR